MTRLAFALDVPTLDEARSLVATLGDAVDVYKVGLELYTAAGPDAVRMVTDAGADCFLDLKLHDIPATVAGAVRSAAKLGTRYLTVHAAGGQAMLRAAAAEGGLELLGVTVLTSLDDEALASTG